MQFAELPRLRLRGHVADRRPLAAQVSHATRSYFCPRFEECGFPLEMVMVRLQSTKVGRLVAGSEAGKIRRGAKLPFGGPSRASEPA